MAWSAKNKAGRCKGRAEPGGQNVPPDSPVESMAGRCTGQSQAERVLGQKVVKKQGRQLKDWARSKAAQAAFWDRCLL